MLLKTAIEIIEKCLADIEKNVVFTKHFKEELEDKEIDQNELIKAYKGHAVGIVEQNTNQYKLILAYSANKDVNIIVEIMNDSKLKFITLFQSYIERRKR